MGRAMNGGWQRRGAGQRGLMSTRAGSNFARFSPGSTETDDTYSPIARWNRSTLPA